MKKTITFLLKKDSGEFFKQSELTQSTSMPILTNCLGFCVNFTATGSEKYGQYLVEQGFLELLFKCLHKDMDLLRRELAIWALRNLSRDEKCCKKICKNENLYAILFEHLETGVKNIVDHTLALMSNIATYVPESHDNLLPVENMLYASKGKLVTII